MQKPELILPAGTIDMLKAAVLNGADAVYLGALRFNARIPAKNFTEDELKEGVDFAHFYGKKVYMTINILIKDSELREAIDLAKKAYLLGVDAIIVQDLGLISALHKLIPDLEIHASTQTTAHNVLGAELLADLRVKKIVLARELSLKEIKEIKTAMQKRGVGVECFIHGALCFSYSGQCTFSSFAFNKSGNRGMCLQPCRLGYELFEKDNLPEVGNREKKFVLSMKDLNTLNDIKPLVEAGIDSFKVEGRLKGISYVATVARAYRKAIDDCFVPATEKKLDKNEEKYVRIAFSREPTKGYAFEEKQMTFPTSPAHRGVLAAKVVGFNQGMLKLELIEPLYKWDRLAVVNKENSEEFQIKEMYNGVTEVNKAFPGEFIFVVTGKRPYVEMGSELYMITSQQLADQAFASLKQTTQMKYNLRVFAVSGQELNAVAEFGKNRVRINSGFTLEESKTAQTTPELIKEKVFKSSTYFSPGEFSSEIKGKPFIPLSKLKDFKAIVMAKMEETLFDKNRREVDETKFNRELEDLLVPIGIEEKSKTISLAVFVDKEISSLAVEQIQKSTEFGTVIHHFSDEKNLAKAKEEFSSKNFFVKSQNIESTSDLYYFDTVTKKENLVCSNLGALFIAKERKKKDKSFRFWVDRELNVFNSLTEKLMIELGAEKVVPSVECSFAQLRKMNPVSQLVPLVLFYPVLMTSKAYSRDPKIKQGDYTLVDRKGFEYKARFDENKLLRLYNPVHVDMLFELERFSEFGLVGIDFSAFDEKGTLMALEFALDKINGRHAKKKFATFTRGHYEKELD
ncbi:MAG: U32 family peptidase [archaeon]|jgi:putative protease